MKRDQVISTIKKAQEDPSHFLELVQQHHSKDSPFDLDEFFQALPRKQRTQVWEALLSLTHSTVDSLSEVVEGDKVDEAVLALLSGVVVCCHSALAQDHPTTPPQCKETLTLLHDILLNLSDVAPDLQNSISRLCERWWAKKGEGEAEDLVPHTLLYLVARTLADGATLSDLHRVWLMRQGFLLLDFEDASADSLKCMLMSCTLQPLYLTSEEGRKLISFLFGMHPKFVEDLHQTIKNQIPHCPKQFLEIYGEIYFRAWKLASGPYLKQIEEHCLQDLMFCAVHAPRQGLHSLFHSLRKLLGSIHQQKNQKGVSEMILRLYNPFLWRALKVANPHVRANAASLLFDAFPLQEPSSTREEVDLGMQKQFDAMMELLNDPSVVVRVTGVVGVCRVLSYFWEMVPAAVIKSLLTRLIRDLAWDASAIGVRVAVLQGLCLVLENRLSHPLLHNLLPLLQNHLHDTSEKVRIALLDLLLLVKGMRTIKFWHICPIEHLLARMEVDSVHVVKRIVALLVDSFQPSHLPPAQQIERCVVLLRANSGAARRFYQLAVTHLSPAEVAKFILAIHSTLVQCVQGDGGEQGEGGKVVVVEGKEGEESAGANLGEDTKEEQEDRDSMSAAHDPTGIAQGGWREEGAGDKSALNEEMEAETAPETLGLEDGELMTGLLETMVVLWEGARDRLDKPTNRTLRSKLVGRVAEKLPLLFDTFKDGPSRSALYLLSSYLPKKSVTSISTGTLQTLGSLSYPTKPQDYSAILVALVAWQQAGHVIKLIKNWLVQEFNGKGGAPGSGSVEVEKKKTKGKRGGKAPNNVTDSPPSPQPMLALEILSWMMNHPVCFQELKKLKEFWEIGDTLKTSMELLESHFSHDTPPPSSPPPSFSLLTNALNVYLRMCMHKRAESDNQEEFGQRVQEVLTWAERVLLPALSATTSSQSSKSVRRSSRKRKVNEAHPSPSTDTTAENARSLVEMLLGVMAEMVLTGLADGTLEVGCAHFAGRVTETASAQFLLPSLCKLLYQLCEASGKCELEGIRTESTLRPTAILLGSVLHLLQQVAETDHERFRKVWLQVKPCVSVAVVMSVRTHSLSVTCHSLAVYSTIVQHVVETQVNHIKKHPTLDPPMSLDDLPLFVSSIVRQSCKDAQTTSLFVSHLCNYLGDCDTKLPDILLTHQASLHLISALAKIKNTGEELVRCIRSSIQLLENFTEDDRHRWNGPISEVSGLLEAVHERLCCADY